MHIKPSQGVWKTEENSRIYFRQTRKPSLNGEGNRRKNSGTNKSSENKEHETFFLTLGSMGTSHFIGQAPPPPDLRVSLLRVLKFHMRMSHEKHSFSYFVLV